MKKELFDLLYKSFDKQLTLGEQKRLEDALSRDVELRKEKEKLEIIENEIKNNTAQSFTPFFSEKIINRIYAEKSPTPEYPEDFFNYLLWSFKRVAIAGLIILMLFLTNNLIQSGSFSIDSVLSLPQLNLEKTLVLDDLSERNSQ